MRLKGMARPWSSIDERTLSWMVILLAAAMGGWLAVYLYGGMIDPRRVTWLLHENDPLQHYMGWHFFRRDEWQWPVGSISNLASALGTSIVFTDSIPLVAIPLKLLDAWLPDPFQYLGLVMLANLMLNAGVACALLLRSGLPNWASWLGGVLFVSLPMATMRGMGAHGHEALSAHWLLLLGIWLLLFYPLMTSRAGWRWLALLSLAVLVHFYLFFMVGVLWAGWWLMATWHARAWRYPRPRWLAMGWGLGTPLWILLVMWGAGYFLGGDIEGGGYGVFSAELLTFFNPLSRAWFLQGDDLVSLSHFVPGWLTPVWGQYEGQAYAGLGGIGLMVAGGTVLANRGWGQARRHWPLALPWLLLLAGAMFVFAMSDHVVIGYRVYDLDYAGWLWPLPDILRSSGRLVWPLLYVLLLAALMLLVREWSSRRLAWVLAGCVLLQWVDLRDWHTSVHDRTGSRLHQVAASPLPYSVLQDPDLEALWESHDRIVALPVEDLAVLRPYTWLAAEHDMSINVAHLARVSPETIVQVTREERARLEAGHLDADAVYLLTAPDLIDRLCTLARVTCSEYEPVTLAWLRNE